MDYNKACIILSIQPPFSESQLKRIYYKEALKNHPDKNGNTIESNEKFKEINEAYSYLSNHKDDSDFIKSIFNTSTLTNLLDSMSFESLQQIYDLLPYLKPILSDDKYQFIIDYISNRTNTIILEPSLDDLFEQKIYIHKSLYYIPLWHHEIIFDSIVFKCKPILPDNIDIDEHNNIIYIVKETLNSLWMKKYIEVFSYKIDIDRLFLRPKQTYILKQKGIPKITKNIYNIELSNIIVEIYIVNV